MRTMTALEYSYIIQNELKQLIGKRFDKIYDAGENLFRIKIGLDVTVEPGVRMNISKYIEKTDFLSGFSMKIRKELSGSRLVDVYQYNNDRIVVFEFSKGILVFEMFGKGNIILVRDGVTVSALKNEKWADREIKAKKEYTFPKTKTVEKLPEKLPEKYIISVMMNLPLGKQYSLEVLSRCGISEKTQANKLSEKDRECIESEIEDIRENLSPRGFYENEKMIDYGLIQSNQKIQSKNFNSFSEAIDEYYFSNREEKSSDEEKLEKRLFKQHESLEGLKKKEIEKRKIAEYIKSNYGKFDEILKTAKNAKMDEIESLLKKYKAKVNKEKKEIEVDV